jgi:hypothetical protein
MDKFLEYLILGLAAVAMFMFGLIGSMIARHRNLEKDLVLIEQLAEEDKAKR